MEPPGEEQTAPHVLRKLALLLGTELKNRTLQIPVKFGKGFCTGFVFNEHIRMLILHYQLYEDVFIEDPDLDIHAKMILFKFQNIFPQQGTELSARQLKALPSVLIATRNMHTELVIPIHTNMASINIEIDANYLGRLFPSTTKSLVLQSLLQNEQPLLYEQLIYPSLQAIIDEILSATVDETFELFYFRVKAEELVCRLLMELEKRDEKQLYALNSRDIQAIYRIKEQILECLSTPPVIDTLAVAANMSPSKLKRLFKQIFGNSIFSYYQGFRMKEAARLLKEEKLSVADVGYRLGFSNLSHFSRIFNEHIGKRPKQYSRS